MVCRNSVTGCRCERSLRSNLLALFLVLVISGCVTAPPTPTPVPVTEATAAPPATSVPADATPSFADRVRNAQYSLGILDSRQVVQLANGMYESGTPGGADFISVRVLDFAAGGDLNGDGRDEVAALVSENYGGTGVFVFRVVYADADGTLTYQNSVIVDDRPQVNAMSIENGEVFLDVVVHGTDEPMCCPTLRTARHYKLTSLNQIDLVDFVTFTPSGAPRTITIEAPPSGVEVLSSVQVRGSVAVAPFENTLAYRIYDLAGVEMAAGAITVNAPDLGAPGTFDTVIQLGSGLSGAGATVRLEVQDISAADGSLLAMDSIELVVK